MEDTLCLWLKSQYCQDVYSPPKVIHRIIVIPNRILAGSWKSKHQKPNKLEKNKFAGVIYTYKDFMTYNKAVIVGIE